MGGVLAGLPKGGMAMTVIPLSPFELTQVILTVILIYVTWKNGKANQDKNAKK